MWSICAENYKPQSMSAPIQTSQPAGEAGSKITFELDLSPALHVEEMENLHRVARARGKTVPELMVSLIREELASAAAGLAA